MRTSVFTQTTNRLQRFAAHHPYLFVLWLLALFVLAGVGVPSVLEFLGLPPVLWIFAGQLCGVLVALLLLSGLHWWRETGFARGLTGQGIRLYLVPLVFIALPSLTQGVAGLKHLQAEEVLTLALLALLIGFIEETFFRGLIMRTLLPKGILFSAIGSSMVFALVHLVNVLDGNFPPAYVSGQLLVTFGSGMLLAALWLRTGSIWPLMLLHAVRDFGGLVEVEVDPKSLSSINSLSAIVGGALLCALLLAYALFLLRPSQLRWVRVSYETTRPLPELGDGATHEPHSVERHV